MKNYLAFFGSDYYPSGGMNDLLGDFDTLDDAIEAIQKEKSNSKYGDVWAHVFSIKDNKEVYSLE